MSVLRLHPFGGDLLLFGVLGPGTVADLLYLTNMILYYINKIVQNVNFSIINRFSSVVTG